MKFKDQLIEMGACSEAVRWVGERSLRKCWQVADRGDWMLWLAAEVGVDRKLLVLAACDCAEDELKKTRVYAKDAQRVAYNAAQKAIETTRAWCEGKATLDAVRKAAEAAEAAAEAAMAARAASITHSAKLVRKRIPVELIEELL